MSLNYKTNRLTQKDFVTVNKFGRSTNVDAHDTDIWDGAVAGDAGDLWVAPTAARVHAIVSASASDTCGTEVLTFTGAAGNGEVVVLGTKTYTFQTVLTNVDGNVLIGADENASITNLIAAVMLTAGAGTTYAAAMTANTPVKTTEGAGTTMNVYDLLSSGITTTTDCANASFTAGAIVAGVGARTIQVYGLPDWDTKEVSETIILNGAGAVNTVNSYVIIHRMVVVTAGASGPNVGIVKATAASDATITAQITAMEGQTQMAIYGIPSIQTFYLDHYYASIIKGVATVLAEITLLVNPMPTTSLLGGWITKHTNGVISAGSNYIIHEFSPANEIPGPAIIKIRGNGSAADIDCSAGFDGILFDN